MKPISPDEVMAKIAAALPADCKENVIIIGSLAAGYHYFSNDGQRSIRTKDVDCMFSPYAKAVDSAKRATESLLKASWTPRTSGDWSKAGNATTELEELPMIRLKPPGATEEDDWFLELLGAPDDQSNEPKVYQRVETSGGHYAICSFNFLALAEWEPIETKHGTRIARPEMMALANMLHHTAIRPELIRGTEHKRSNKDLGRVLALAWLAVRRDSINGTQELDAWAQRMSDALKARFPTRAKELAFSAGLGIRALMKSDADMDQALRICNLGLLASLEVNRDAYKAIGNQFLQRVIDLLERHFP